MSPLTPQFARFLALFIVAVSAISSSVNAQAPPAQPSGLKIVVIKGEDAVNIIQQKTAVAPVVEVRDRNNLPVPGVAVTFTVGGGQGATFGGLSTLTVTTNAAGQAAAAGFAPTAAGAVQINATALVQGQALTATITQTNVLTAAQAAAASGAGAGGGASGGTAGTGGAAAGGGGGLSTTTLVVAGAAVAGGATVAATQLGGDSGGDTKREFAGPFTGDLSLTFPGPPSCVRVERYTGTLVIELDSLTGDQLHGTATIEQGGTVVVSLTGSCSGGPQVGQTDRGGMPPTAISGPPGNLQFTVTETAATGRTTMTAFTGALSGDRITGNLTITTKANDTVVGGFTSGVTLTPH